MLITSSKLWNYANYDFTLLVYNNMYLILFIVHFSFIAQFHWQSFMCTLKMYKRRKSIILWMCFKYMLLVFMFQSLKGKIFYMQIENIQKILCTHFYYRILEIPMQCILLKSLYDKTRMEKTMNVSWFDK